MAETFHASDYTDKDGKIKDLGINIVIKDSEERSLSDRVRGYSNILRFLQDLSTNVTSQKERYLRDNTVKMDDGVKNERVRNFDISLYLIEDQILHLRKSSGDREAMSDTYANLAYWSGVNIKFIAPETRNSSDSDKDCQPQNYPSSQPTAPLRNWINRNRDNQAYTSMGNMGGSTSSESFNSTRKSRTRIKHTNPYEGFIDLSDYAYKDQVYRRSDYYPTKSSPTVQYCDNQGRKYCAGIYLPSDYDVEDFAAECRFSFFEILEEECPKDKNGDPRPDTILGFKLKKN